MIIIESGPGRYTEIGGRIYSYFAGNNYLGLAGRTEIKNEAIAAIEKYGMNFAASRRTTGTARLHLDLERALSDFKGKEAAVVFSSGYLGDKILLDSLKQNYTLILADESSHPSIEDGIPSGVPLLHYRHCNSGHLETLLQKNSHERPLVITDGVFALTGEIAPLGEIHSLAEKYGATVIVDDAHGTGILGTNGRGTPEYFGLDSSSRIFQAETMSKALGNYGGFIASSHELIQEITSSSRIYSGSTALPPAIVAGAIAAIRILMHEPGLRTSLFNNAKSIREGIAGLGYDTTPGPAPVIPLLFKTAAMARDLSGFLYEQGIVAPFVDYPVKTGRYIVRITVSAVHSPDQIENLILALSKWRETHESN